MKLSVSLITYNHGPFIARAIEGCLEQKTDFDFEIVIGEDDSPDGTREIVEDYVRRYPGRIRALFRSREDVIYVDGRPTGRFNFLETLKACQSDYVAMLEGDDYWTDPHKLRKQVEYLDAHPDCAFCFHDVALLKEDGELSRDYPLGTRQPTYTLRDILHLNGSACVTPQTGSVVLRRAFLPELPPWMRTLPFGDLPLFALLSRRGFAGFIDEAMGVYRIHGGGLWSAGGKGKWSPAVTAQRQDWRLRFYETMREWLNGELSAEIDEKIGELACELAWHHQQHGDATSMRRYLVKALRSCPVPPTFSAKFVLKAWLVAFMPGAHRLYQKRRAALSPPPAEG